MTVIEKKEKQKLNLFFLAEYLLCAVIVLCTFQQQASLVSAAFTATFLLAVAWFGKLVIVDGRNTCMTVVFLMVVLSTIFVVASGVLNDEDLNMAFLTNHLCFLSTVMFLFVIMNTEPDSRTGKIILVFNVFFAYVYFWAYRFIPQGDDFFVLYLNFTNPNLAAMWILQSVLYAMVALVVLKSVLLKLLAAISIPLNVWLIGETDARNCILTLLLFAVVYVWSVLKQRPRFSKGLILGVVVFPIAFVPVYLTYVKTIMSKGWFDFLIDEGKSLDSRVWVWQERLENIREVWLIGNYALTGGNAHNSHMVLLTSYGAIGLALGIWLLYSVCVKVNEQLRSRKNLFALAAFFGVLFMGIGEGALFSGGQGLFVMACGFLYLARCDFGEDKASVLSWQKKNRK